MKTSQFFRRVSAMGEYRRSAVESPLPIHGMNPHNRTREIMTSRVVSVLTDEWLPAGEVAKIYNEKFPENPMKPLKIGRWLGLASDFRKCENDMKQFGTRVFTMKRVYRRNQNAESR